MSRKLILLVDDDRDTLEAYAVLFQALGHATASAPDGPRGVAAALQLRPDLILLDIGMPRMNGIEALRRIRADAAGARIPVIVLTGHAVPSDLAEARRHGCHAFLTKPCEPLALCQAVEAALHARVPAAPHPEAARKLSEGILVRPPKPARTSSRRVRVDGAHSLESLCLWADFLRRRSEGLRETAAGLVADARTIRSRLVCSAARVRTAAP